MPHRLWAWPSWWGSCPGEKKKTHCDYSCFKTPLTVCDRPFCSFYNTKSVILCLGITALVCLSVTIFSFQSKVSKLSRHFSGEGLLPHTHPSRSSSRSTSPPARESSSPCAWPCFCAPSPSPSSSPSDMWVSLLLEGDNNRWMEWRP